MPKEYRKIIDNGPVLWTEDVYLCTHTGKILTGRCSKSLNRINVFDLLDASDVRFLQNNMCLPGFTPLALVESREGMIIFDLSLCPKYGLLIAILPYFSKHELLKLAGSELSHRIMLSESLKKDAESHNGCTVSEGLSLFAWRLTGYLIAFACKGMGCSPSGDFLG